MSKKAKEPSELTSILEKLSKGLEAINNRLDQQDEAINNRLDQQDLDTKEQANLISALSDKIEQMAKTKSSSSNHVVGFSSKAKVKKEVEGQKKFHPTSLAGSVYAMYHPKVGRGEGRYHKVCSKVGCSNGNARLCLLSQVR